jgi:ATP-dependent RNA helicase DBP3
VFGGVAKEPQVKMLRNANKGKNEMTTKIVVGTPGRILDLVQDGACDLSGWVSFDLSPEKKLTGVGILKS